MKTYNNIKANSIIVTVFIVAIALSGVFILPRSASAQETFSDGIPSDVQCCQGVSAEFTSVADNKQGVFAEFTPVQQVAQSGVSAEFSPTTQTQTTQTIQTIDSYGYGGNYGYSTGYSSSGVLPFVAGAFVGAWLNDRYNTPTYYTTPVVYSNPVYTNPVVYTTPTYSYVTPITQTIPQYNVQYTYPQTYSYNYPYNYNYPASYYNYTPQYTAQYTPPAQTYQAPTTPYVALTQIPYTGFDFGPIGNALYWLSLIGFAVAGAYLMIYYLSRFAAIRIDSEESLAATTPVEAHAEKTEQPAATPVSPNYSGTRDSMTAVLSRNGLAPRIVITRT